MRKGFPIVAIVVVTLICVSGCALVDATATTAKVVGKTTVKAAKATVKVVTWPVREVVKRSKESQTTPEPPLTTVQHGQSEAKPTRTASAPTSGPRVTIDGDVKLTQATEEKEKDEDDTPPPRRRKKAAVVAAADEDDTKADDAPAPRRKSKPVADEAPATENEDLDKTPIDSDSKKSPNWRSKRTAKADSSDPDTIRIQ